MGSGKRKGSDVLRVNVPQQTIGEGGGSGSHAELPVDINRKCPINFNAVIKPKQVLPNNVPVTIQGTELFAINEHVGKLSQKHLKIIVECGAEGIRYVGRVLNKDKKSYARFEQKF